MNVRYVPAVEDDRRHRPGTGALRYWNESFWFPVYDPRHDLGVIFRAGAFPVADGGHANFYLFLLHRGETVLQISDQRLPLAPWEPASLRLENGFTVEWLEPLQSFRLEFSHARHGFDLRWEGVSPPFLYPPPPGTTVEQVPRHIEQGGRARGRVVLGGRTFEVDAWAHRDHTFGGERDWDKFYRWNYLCGAVDGFWFNAVRVRFLDATTPWIHVGCLWNGEELRDLSAVEMTVHTADGGTRQTGVEVVLTDERGEKHEIRSEEVLGVGSVRIWRTWLKDGVVRYRYRGREGYGILEHGYVEGAELN